MSKPGRNDPCPCGSGKKYKQCHGAAGAPAAAARPAQAAVEAMQLVRAGMGLQQAGAFDDAERLYRQALAQSPRLADALHLLGLLEHQRGNQLEGAALIQRAIKLQANVAAYHNNCGEALRAAGKVRDALGYYETACKLQPDFAEGWVNRGVTLRKLGRLEDAIASYGRAIALRPDFRDAHMNLGHALRAAGNMPEAVRAYRAALRITEDDASACNALGILLSELEEYAEAEKQFAHGLALEPDSPELHNSIATLMTRQSRLDGALMHYLRAVALNPGYNEAYRNIGTLQIRTGEFREAVASFEHALSLRGDDGDSRFNLSQALLALCGFERGWQEYEARFHKQTDSVAAQDFAHRVWQGEPLAGKSLLVWDEQGLGDEIWMSGMFGELLQREDKPARLVIECRPKLVPLFKRSFPGAEVVAKSDPPNEKCFEGIDYQIAAGSLGRYLRPDLASFPKREETGGAYLVADSERERYWKEHLGKDHDARLKVGISWRSSNTKGERALSCTRLTEWGDIFKIEGVRFINLQYDECEAELKEAEAKFGIEIERYEVDMFDDLDETAALMRSLDLVISAPTSVGILSAALGVPTWQLNYGEDWQCHGLPNNPWYPAMRNIVRRWDEGWNVTLGKAARMLQAVVENAVNNESEA